jgi:hypothetical protein
VHVRGAQPRRIHKTGVVLIVCGALVGAGLAAAPTAEAKTKKKRMPAITKVSPVTGATSGKQRITIRGKNFAHVTKVTFGAAAGTRVKTVSNTEITVLAPKHSAANVHIRVTTKVGHTAASAKNAFRYVGVPTVSKLSTAVLDPAGNQQLTLTGTNFVGSEHVYFGRVAARIVRRVSEKSLVVRTPAHRAALVSVSVTTPYGRSKATPANQATYRIAPVYDLAATPATSAVTLTWSNPTDPNLSGVVIRRARGTVAPVGPSDGTPVATLGDGQTTYTDPNLSSSSHYSYAVFAQAGSKNLATPAAVSVTTKTLIPGVPGLPVQPTSNYVTADALPTVQINGVVWSQVVVGNTVYAGGSFTTARPAQGQTGSPVTRSNLLAYDIVTGKLVTTFAPSLNAQVLSVAASPDGRTIYAGGDFTSVNGTSHSRIVALNATTGAVVSSFAASANGEVRSIVPTASAVYVGGFFNTANNTSRPRGAAFNPATGALTSWRPAVGGGYVYAMVMTPDKSKIVLGGNYDSLNGATMLGIGAVNVTTGKSVPWLMEQKLQNYGNGSAVYSLSTDGSAVYGTGYNYGVHHDKSYEGAWSADPADGSLNWFEDCHGDTYGVFGVNGAVYTVGHAHYCWDDNGWPSYNPWQVRRTMAWTPTATGTLRHYTQGGNYNDFYGTPAPSIVNWFPDMTAGTYTGQSQAAWSVTGNARYVVEGGEFTTVNNAKQQGLVRFAVRGTTGDPGIQGPRVSGGAFVPTLQRGLLQTVRVSFTSNWDRDDQTLTYRVVRDGTTVWTHASDANWWKLPILSFTDSNVPAGKHTYYLTATDPHGNTVSGSPVSITTL